MVVARLPKELGMDLHAFLGANAEQALRELFQDQGIAISEIKYESPNTDNLFRPAQIQLDDGQTFRVNAKTVNGNLEFTLDKV